MRLGPLERWELLVATFILGARANGEPEAERRIALQSNHTPVFLRRHFEFVGLGSVDLIMNVTSVRMREGVKKSDRVVWGTFFEPNHPFLRPICFGLEYAR